MFENKLLRERSEIEVEWSPKSKGWTEEKVIVGKVIKLTLMK